MFRRREPVPFAFLVEAEKYRSNVEPPPRERPQRGELVVRALVGLTVVGGLVGSLLFGLPALSQETAPRHTQHSEASDPR
ncbi:hypothetical protein [Streptomyces sp. SPB074]|uniref:hypothetical protein n=1 Tax=Streptomyces sp. (strain SPB074) TaxID=465543 RepID=UPI00017F1802|nr:hypothetical protein [Streptomyces sp. SPB074]